MVIDIAKEFWTVSSRYNRNKSNPLMAGAAGRHMLKLAEETSSRVIANRASRFAANRKIKSHGDFPDGGGPKPA